MPRLPVPGSDDGIWGDLLNEFLGVSHTGDGTLKANSVYLGALQANSVSNTKLQDGAVTASKLDTSNMPTSSQVLSSNGSGLAWVAQSAAPVSSVAGKTGAVSLTASDVGLGNVNNTADADKPVSTATQTALNTKANTTHTHAITDTTGLQSALDGKSASAHNHAIADVTNLQTTLDGKISSSEKGVAGGVASLNSSGKIPNVTNPTDPQDAATKSYVDASVSAKADKTQAIARVVHNGSSYPARPSGYAYVEYIGPDQPTDWINGDTWIDTTP
jgi:hypothetical protein